MTAVAMVQARGSSNEAPHSVAWYLPRTIVSLPPLLYLVQLQYNTMALPFDDDVVSTVLGFLPARPLAIFSAARPAPAAAGNVLSRRSCT